MGATEIVRLPLRPIFLIGFMGSGKTTVGEILAALIDRPFIDLDQKIVESAGRPVHEVIADEGEEGFRRRESARLAEAAASSVVVATGGGAILLAENRQLMQSHGMTVWIDVPFEVCWERIASDTSIRPLAPDRATALERFNKRRPLYAESQWRIDGRSKTAEEIAREIISRLSETKQIEI